MSAETSSSRTSAGSEEVEVSGRGRGIRVIDLPAVFSSPQEREMLRVITAFDLSRNELHELTQLHPLRSLARLNASYNRIRLVEGLPLQLTQLNLAHNKLEHLDCVGQLLHLRELDVSFNRLTSLAGLHAQMPLEVLKADDNRIERTSGLEGLRLLRIASLNNNYIENLDELFFASSTPSLQLLHLVGNPVTRARRYRQTLAELRPSLVSLDGAPLTRPAHHRPKVESSFGSNGSRMRAEASPSISHSGSVERSEARRDAVTPINTAAAAAAATASTKVEHCDSRKDNSCQPAYAGDVDAMAAPRDQREAAASALDDSGVYPRDSPPQPLLRSAASSISQRCEAAAASTEPQKICKGGTGPAARGSASKTLASQTRGATPSGGRPGVAPNSVTDVLPTSTHCAASGAAEMLPGEIIAPDRVSKTSTRAMSAKSAAMETTVSRTPEDARAAGGYAALHATPSPRRSRAARNTNARGASSEPAPRSVLSQGMDATIAQLHDSLVTKEELEKECHTLRQACKRAEGQLTEARRVMSQQLAELSRLRLERDALRQGEGALLERLEKEKRAGRTRAAHHQEEVATLQAQYERMKTFYETQLADTRCELTAERARLLRRCSSGNDSDERGGAETQDRRQRKREGSDKSGVRGSSPSSAKVLKAQRQRRQQREGRKSRNSTSPQRVTTPVSPASQNSTTEEEEKEGQRSDRTAVSDAVAGQLLSWIQQGIGKESQRSDHSGNGNTTAVTLAAVRRSLRPSSFPPAAVTATSPAPLPALLSAEDGGLGEKKDTRIRSEYGAAPACHPPPSGKCTSPHEEGTVRIERTEGMRTTSGRCSQISSPSLRVADAGELMDDGHTIQAAAGTPSDGTPSSPVVVAMMRGEEAVREAAAAATTETEAEAEEEAEETVVIPMPSGAERIVRTPHSGLSAVPVSSLTAGDARVTAARALLREVEGLFQT